MKSYRKPVIDMETLQIWDSVKSCADCLGVRKPAITNNILLGYRTRGHRLEYLDYWRGLDPWQKEKYTERKNIYFLT